MKNESIPATQWSKALLPILAQGHELKIPLVGRSMRPLLVGGRDEAVLASVHGKSLKPGDIVLYVRQDGTHVLHRIHHIEHDFLYMLGDAHTEIEGPIHRENVLAIAIVVVRKGKNIDCSQPGYRLISGFWLKIRRMRPIVIQLINIKNKIKKAFT